MVLKILTSVLVSQEASDCIGEVESQAAGMSLVNKSNFTGDLESDDPWACVICQDEPKDHVIMRCMHVCGCGSCAQIIRDGLCPLCRGGYSSICKVFY